MADSRKIPPVAAGAIHDPDVLARRVDWQADKALMQRVASSDSGAWSQVAIRLLPRVRMVARGLLRSDADAADATQNALLEVLRSAGNFRGESSLETWADRITVRVSLRAVRRRGREGVDLDDVPEPVATPEESPSELLPRPLLEYLDRLSPSRREVLTLRYMLDYSVMEISEVLSVPRDTIKYRLKQALSELRSHVRRDQLLKRGAS
jgi:RNA polymerase sigma-70 factor, ECF subfamily